MRFLDWLRNIGGVDFDGRRVRNVQSLHVGAKEIADDRFALQVTGRTYLVTSYTTADRDAITDWEDGEVILNTTTGKYQGRTGAAWVDFH